MTCPMSDKCGDHWTLFWNIKTRSAFSIIGVIIPACQGQKQPLYSSQFNAELDTLPNSFLHCVELGFEPPD